MYSSKVIKSIFEDLKRITKADYALHSLDGKELEGTFKKGTIREETVEAFALSGADSQTLEGNYFFRLKSSKADNFILIVNAYGGDGYMLGRIALSELMHILGVGDDASDKQDFYRGIINDSLLPSDIEREAGRLKIAGDLTRNVYQIRISPDFVLPASEMIGNMYSDSKEDYLIPMSDDVLVLIKKIDEDDAPEVADEIMSMINTELMTQCKVSFGKSRQGLSGIRESYLEAGMAMEIGDIFFEEKSVVSYRSLGLGRIIYQLPMSLCELFMEEIFGTGDNNRNKKNNLTKDELDIIDSFFENSLSIAEVSRQLDIKRSTLVHRVDVIKKKTGLDIRVFNDAMTMKVAIMVAKYMDYRKRKYGTVS